ncbi:metal-dependent hydrolase [Epibacterium ulvae]|uniref:metal-dependent hydrolase n=1 Tax=Epibacterium ulvae TaxID=1156985 RepID=UPI001BFCCEAD|nr:metal-dependent hydrolase [Epibacterium ulvae]MBT8154478.1 metal-dependent hydrolase [Epibacterium ulvae]
MNIVWLGHASFRLESDGKVLLIDPWLTGNPMLKEDQHEAALAGTTHILLTHAHFDHAADIVTLAKKLDVPVVGQFDLMNFWGESEGIETLGFNKGGTVDLDGIKVSMVAASHSSTFGGSDGLKVAGSEVGFMIEVEGKTVYVSGDTDIMADMEWMGDFYKPEIGILSAGGHFTMGMKGAAYAAKRYFNFKTVIPCHYKTFPLLEQNADELTTALPDVDVIEPEVLAPITL